MLLVRTGNSCFMSCCIIWCIGGLCIGTVGAWCSGSWWFGGVGSGSLYDEFCVLMTRSLSESRRELLAVDVLGLSLSMWRNWIITTRNGDQLNYFHSLRIGSGDLELVEAISSIEGRTCGCENKRKANSVTSRCFANYRRLTTWNSLKLLLKNTSLSLSNSRSTLDVIIFPELGLIPVR